MIPQLLFLFAYACSGLAGLIYEVSWTRLLTLYMGHSTAAASAVVAAFMGGLAVGSAAGGTVAGRWSRRDCLRAYIGLELFVAVVAVLLPFELRAFTPILRAAYQNGDASAAFAFVRLLSCLFMMFAPAVALGATFPIAVRWFVTRPEQSGSAGGALYAVNTAGAAAGALVAGFVLIPTVGVAWTTRVGVVASVVAVAAIAVLGRMQPDEGGATAPVTPGGAKSAGTAGSRGPRRPGKVSALSTGRTVVEAVAERPWLAAVVLGITGLASLIFEIVWTRVLAMTIGPTVYAFSATLAVLIGGMAIGSALGAVIASRVRRPAAWLAATLGAAAIASSWACSLAGGEVPMRVAREVAAAPDSFDGTLTRGALLIALLILPTAIGFGAAFPLAFAMLGQGTSAQPGADRPSSRLGTVYAINTVGAVAGSLAAGFLLIPSLGLQETLRFVSVLLIVSVAILIFFARLTDVTRTVVGLVGVAAVAMLAFTPPWDRELLASGGYIYAPYLPKTLDLESALKAGTLLYYREGASATVSVKKLTGTISLAIDGKVDASTRSDMLTQRIVAHLPMLLHDNPKQICIIGLGSGVTLGSALRHPIERADLIELSPEVVEASRYFDAQNYQALHDPRTHLIVGDGRSHLLLADRKYDVIMSEPSNPWIAGVASLFTREFFTAARDRLAPGGVICQWAHTYNISDGDLRSIVATFRSVFPNGTVWLIGEEDVLLVASADPAGIDARLGNIEKGWSRPGVAKDLETVNVREPFSMLSLFAGGPSELTSYTSGATVFTDDLSALEFSAPRELHRRAAGANAANLSALLKTPATAPAAVRDAFAKATAANWHNRAAMMFKSDMFASAYDDEVRAIELDPGYADALNGLVDATVMTGRYPDATTRLKIAANRAPTSMAAKVAQARLLASTGSHDDAVLLAKEASRLAPGSTAPLEELAAIYADSSNVAELDKVVDTLTTLAPRKAPTLYYAAAAAFLHDDFARATALARDAVAADPTYSAVYDLAGAAALKAGDVKAARAAFEKSLEFNGHDSSAYANLGLIDLAGGDHRTAANELTEALLLDPDSEAAHQGLLHAQPPPTR